MKLVAASKPNTCDVCRRSIHTGDEVALCSKRIGKTRAVSVPRHPNCATDEAKRARGPL